MSDGDLVGWLTALTGAEGSDLHVKVGSPPRIRVDGQLRRLSGEPGVTPESAQAMAASIMPAEVGERFAAHHEADFAHSIAGIGRFRVNVFLQRGSVAMVFRRVLQATTTIEALGLPPVVGRLAEEQRGLVLVTGPTGSGKTTTLAAMIGHINTSRECHIVTIEDPIEVLHKDEMASISQREIGFDTDGFAVAMRAAMRQDPDVILVGEMRDTETVDAALRAAETGHLVLSTLHTSDTTETVNRIVDFFPPYQHNQVRTALASTLKGVVSQRLVPAADGTGRVAVVEVLVVNGRVQNCIVEPAKTAEIADIIAEGDYYGMQTFDQALVKLFRSGKIDLKGAMLAASRPHDLKLMLANEGLVRVGAA